MRKTTMTLLSMLLFACGGGDDAAPSEYPPPMPLDAQYTACGDVSECEVLELGCCDACNGGTAVAVHKEHAADVMERHSERCGASTACTSIGCAPWELSCEQGVCGLQRGSF
ncbi:MAG: hypothetical protein OEZ06_13235 [Myxococcales bacterium]|nr:hypothetical protein [Myxococcales bacterium]